MLLNRQKDYYLIKLLIILFIVLLFGLRFNVSLYLKMRTSNLLITSLCNLLFLMLIVWKILSLFIYGITLRLENQFLIVQKSFSLLKTQKKIKIKQIEFNCVVHNIESISLNSEIKQKMMHRRNSFRRLFNLKCRNYMIDTGSGNRIINDLSEEDVLLMVGKFELPR